MTTINQARQSVYSRFKAQWEAQAPPVPAYTFEAEKFTPPVGAPWARATVRNLVGFQETLGPPGARKFGRRALVFVQIFAPAGSGMAGLDLLGSLARGIFEGVSFDGLSFAGATLQEVGVDNGWNQVQLEAPFFYDETK